MNALEFLERERKQKYYNLSCYSKNLSMTIAEEGYEAEWEATQEECWIIEELIAREKGELDRPTIGPLVITESGSGWENVKECMEQMMAAGIEKGGANGEGKRTADRIWKRGQEAACGS